MRKEGALAVFEGVIFAFVVPDFGPAVVARGGDGGGGEGAAEVALVADKWIVAWEAGNAASAGGHGG